MSETRTVIIDTGSTILETETGTFDNKRIIIEITNDKYSLSEGIELVFILNGSILGYWK